MQFLPDGYTDFIFAIYAEEFGFFGIIILLSIFSVLVGRIFILSHRALKEKNWYIAGGGAFAIFCDLPALAASRLCVFYSKIAT
mgnify:CR=1 FL=1